MHNTSSPDVSHFFWKALGEQTEDWLDDREELIPSGDFNEDVGSHQMKTFFDEHNVKERVTESVDHSPETCKGNLSGKTMDAELNLGQHARPVKPQGTMHGSTTAVSTRTIFAS